MTGIYLPEEIVIDAATDAHVPVKFHSYLASERAAKHGWAVDLVVLKRQSCVIGAAGYAAEKIYCASVGEQFDERLAYLGADSDAKLVREVWGKPVFFHFAAVAQERLEQPPVWAAVTTLATALLARKGTMPADEVLGILLESTQTIEPQLFVPGRFSELIAPGAIEPPSTGATPGAEMKKG